jgi:hypothetical protein
VHHAAPPPPVAPPTPVAPVPDIPPAKQGPSPAVVGLLAAVGLAALLAVLYLYVIPNRSSDEKVASTPAALETPGPAGSSAGTHPLAKHLEISGIRLRDLKGGKATIQFVVINHSAADLPDLTIDVTVRSADRVFFEVPAKVPSLEAFEVKDLSASVATDLKSYELPDWQLIRPQFQVRTD